MRLIGIDFETNGPEPTLCDVTEAAWAFYDTELSQSPIVSKVFLNNDVKEMDPGAEKVTGISLERCHTFGIPREAIKDMIMHDLEWLKPEYLVAHNAKGFDKIIFDRLFPENGCQWIDTMDDLPMATYERLGTRTLEFMAARSGFLNPFPHAALPDVMTMMKILLNEDVEQVALRSKVPTVTIAADVSFEEKHLAKERGYFWESCRGGKKYYKKWVKTIKQDEVSLEQEAAPFSVAIVG